MSRIGVFCLTALLLWPAAGQGQDVPRTTPEGVKAVSALIAVCTQEGALKRAGQGATASWQIDTERLRAVVADQRAALDTKLCNALVADTRSALTTPARAGERPMLLALLEAVGQETKDERVLGFAAFFRGYRFQEQLAQLEDASTSYRKAREHFENVGARDWLALTCNNLGAVLDSQGKNDEALRCVQRALAIRLELYPADRFPEGHLRLVQTLNGLGLVHKARTEYEESQRCFKKSLAMCRELFPADRYPRGHRDMANCLANLGSLYEAQGDYDHALPFHQQALAMRQKLFSTERFPNGHPHLALSLNNVGLAYHFRGDYGESLRYHLQALAMNEKLYPSTRFPQGHPSLATALNNLGFVYVDRKEYGEARHYYQKALTMRQKLFPVERYPDGHPLLAGTLSNLGLLFRTQGNHPEALRHLEQALAMYQKLYPVKSYPNGHPLLANCLNNLALIYQAQGEHDEAVRCCRQSLAMRAKLYPAERYPQGHPELASSLNRLGFLLHTHGDHEEALRCYERAAQALRTTIEPVDLENVGAAAEHLRGLPLTVTALANRAVLLAQELPSALTDEQLQAAERACDLALAVQDRLRFEEDLDEETRVQHGAANANLVPLRVSLCARHHALRHEVRHLHTAFATLERSRARVFLESLGRARASRLAGLSPELLAEEERLAQRLRHLDAETGRLQALHGKDAVARMNTLLQQRQQIEKEQRRFEARLVKESPRYAALRYPQPCTLAEARRGLDANEVALLFTVGKDESYVLIVSARPTPGDKDEGLALVRLPGRGALDEQIDTLTRPENLSRLSRSRALGAALYRDLLGPLAAHLKGKDLVLVPDGPLSYLPFELLVEPGAEDQQGRYLIEGHRIRYAPSLSSLHLIVQWEKERTVEPDQPLFAVGDPVYDPRELGPAAGGDNAEQQVAMRLRTSGIPQLHRLPGSGAEVQAVRKLLGAGADEVLTRRAATEAAVKEASRRGVLARARYVHFATHGYLAARRGSPPALVLSQVGITGKDDEYGRDDGLLTLPEVSALKMNADLVVLSACQTGRGRLDSNEGVSGLARVFFYAGCRGVLCSLWSVEDQATATLMQATYQSLKEGKSSAEALRQAQLKLIADEQPPLHWAPFILLGR